MNIKKYLNNNGTAVPPYCEINREERGACAILYHLILKEIENPAAQKSFSKSVLGIVCDHEFIRNTEVYMEYTYLRDLWKTLAGGNIDKHGYICNAISNFIQELLPQANNHDKGVLNSFLSTINGFNNGGSINFHGFNTIFVAGNISVGEIQSPSRWGEQKLGDLVHGLQLNDGKLAEELFEKLLFFKWAFNIKPDLVLCYPDGSVACIEAKVWSGEGSYSATHSSGLKRTAKQTKVQQYLMEKILGFSDPHYFFLSRNGNTKDNFTGIAWKQAFDYFNLKQEPVFIQKQIKNYI